MSETRIDMIKRRLEESLQPLTLQIQDDSHKHAGHTGNKGGGGHYTVLLVAPAFAGQTLIQRHRMVYNALGDAMHTDIHALSIKAYTPEEYANQ